MKEAIQTLTKGEKIAAKLKGRKQSPEFCINQRLYRIGKKHSEETKQKIRLGVKGENNGNWKGENLGIKGIHYRIKTQLPVPELCQMCNKIPPKDLANISGKYLLDLTDWQYLCRKCHMISDNRIFNLRNQEPKTT